MKGRVYLSGKITGLPMEEVEKKFSEAEDYFVKKGYKVESPLKISPYKEGKQWHEYMMEDLPVLMQCDAIALLDDIENNYRSAGMIVECIFASQMKKTVLKRHEDGGFYL